jgi:uncharacterized protein YciI
MDFDAFTLVLLVDGPTPEVSDPAALQDAHLAHLASLRDAGILVGAGPARSIDRTDLRGLVLLRADIDEARRLAEADPAVEAGRVRVEVVSWTVPADAITAGPGHLPRSMAEVRGEG